MTVTVSTSLDTGDGAPAAVPVDATSAVQAARAFAAQAQEYLAQANRVLLQAQQAEAGAQLAYDQAQGLYNLAVAKITSQLGAAGLAGTIAGLPTTQPAQAGVLWLNGGYVVLS